MSIFQTALGNPNPGNPGNSPVWHQDNKFYFRLKTLVKKDPSYRAFTRNEK